jgi:hypothetical protein
MALLPVPPNFKFSFVKPSLLESEQGPMLPLHSGHQYRRIEVKVIKKNQIISGMAIF